MVAEKNFKKLGNCRLDCSYVFKRFCDSFSVEFAVKSLCSNDIGEKNLARDIDKSIKQNPGVTNEDRASVTEVHLGLKE